MDEINRAIREVNDLLLDGTGSTIVYGGVCDQDTYQGDVINGIGTLFLLKEVNDPNGKSAWSLVDHIRNQASCKSDSPDKHYEFYRLWKNVARWMRLILKPDQNFIDLADDDLRAALIHIAAINVNKAPGNPSSNAKVLLHHLDASANCEVLLREIDILAPRLVVCGGTFDLAVKLLGVEAPKLLSNGARYFKLEKRVFLEAPHPAWFVVNDRILFAYFKDTMNALRHIKD